MVIEIKVLGILSHELPTNLVVYCEDMAAYQVASVAQAISKGLNESGYQVIDYDASVVPPKE